MKCLFIVFDILVYRPFSLRVIFIAIIKIVLKTAEMKTSKKIKNSAYFSLTHTYK